MNNFHDPTTMTREASVVINFIRGVVYPTSKSELVAHASLRGAPERALEILHRLPEREYANPAEVIDHIEAEAVEVE